MNKDVEATLKSIETENYFDRLFYRPIGYKIANAIKNTGITPNVVTIISIFIGISAGICWYFPHDIILALLGILALVIANILDCVDGQLARMTGIKSQVGRILDGFAGFRWTVERLKPLDIPEPPVRERKGERGRRNGQQVPPLLSFHLLFC